MNLCSVYDCYQDNSVQPHCPAVPNRLHNVPLALRLRPLITLRPHPSALCCHFTKVKESHYVQEAAAHTERRSSLWNVTGKVTQLAFDHEATSLNYIVTVSLSTFFNSHSDASILAQRHKMRPKSYRNHPNVWSTSGACQQTIIHYHQWGQLGLLIIVFCARSRLIRGSSLHACVDVHATGWRSSAELQ